MLLALLLAAQSPTDLSAFRPFVGSCWRSQTGSVVSDTHCFESMFGGRHIRDRHEVRENGKVVYSGETIYSVDGNFVVFTYYTSLGGIGRGTVAREGSMLTFLGKMRGRPSEAPQDLVSFWKIVDANHYEVNTPPSLLSFTRVK